MNRLSMSNLLEFGAMLNRDDALRRSCTFIHTEGPVRLAHMIQEMRTLPDPFLSQPMINRVYNWYRRGGKSAAIPASTHLPLSRYVASFRDMIEYPSLLSADREVQRYSDGFTQLISDILRRHAPTVMTIALVGRRRRWMGVAGD